MNYGSVKYMLLHLKACENTTFNNIFLLQTSVSGFWTVFVVFLLPMCSVTQFLSPVDCFNLITWACTMMVAEQIQLQDQFPVDKSKPLQSGFVGTMMLIINFLCQLRLWSWVCGALAHTWTCDISGEQPITCFAEQVWFTPREWQSEIRN